MLTQYVVVEDYKIRMGTNSNEHDNISSIIKSTIARTINEISQAAVVRFYNLGGDYHTHNVGSPKRKLIIFNNGSKAPVSTPIPKSPVSNQAIVIDGWVLERTYNKLNKNENLMPIKDGSGVVIAQWDKEKWQLDILLDLFKDVNDSDSKIFSYIMKQLNDILIEEGYDNSWKRTNDKSVMTNNIKQFVSSNIERDKSTLKRNIEDYKNDLDTYRNRIKSISDSLILKMNQLDSINSVVDTKANNIIRDLDLIIGNENVDDIKFENDIFTIYTNHLNITSDRGDTYSGGKFKIKLNMNNSDVHFFSDNRRRGYWTENDPHPHVDGSSGRPCLGNVSSTIAELCSQGELYALTLICVDFLQSANTEDVAGKNIRNWDKIDEGGNIIPAVEYRSETEYTCDRCGNVGDYEEEETHNVYTYYDERNEELGEEQLVCEDCRYNHYEYNDEINEVIGEIINPINYVRCDSCADNTDEEETNLVYETYDVLNDELGDERYICDGCLGSYTWDDNLDVYVGEYINEEPDEDEEE